MVEICAIPRPLVRIQSGVPKTVSSISLETFFVCGKLGELKPDLTTIARFAIQLSYYAMSNLQHPLQSRAGGLFVLVEGMGIRLAAVCRREWTFSSCGKQFFLRISLKR